MKPSLLAAPFLALILACPALAEPLKADLLARGDDGPEGASCTELTSPEALARWKTGLTLPAGKAVVGIALGTQPAGTRIVGARVRTADKYGWEVRISVRVSMPARPVKGVARPFVILAFQSSPIRVEHRVRVRLQMGDTTLQSMSLEAAAKTRDKIARMRRKHRKQVAALHAANAAERARLAKLEQEVLALDKAPAYVAAERGQSFENAIRRGVEIAALKTDLHFFGTTMNPMITTGDESLKYLPKDRKRWSKEIAEGYAEEAKYIAKAIGEIESLLNEMKALVKAHAAEQKKGGLVQGVSKN